MIAKFVLSRSEMKRVLVNWKIVQKKKITVKYKGTLNYKLKREYIYHMEDGIKCLAYVY